MDAYALILLGTGLTLEAVLILHGQSRDLFSRFPLFYSYIAYAFSAAVVATLTLWLWPISYPRVFWFNMLVMTLAEFAVVLELAEKVFHSHPVVLRMGRIIVVAICVFFLAFSILPSILVSQPADVKLLDLLKHFSLAKCLAIVAILGLARIYRLTPGRPIAGMVIGFAIYFSVSTANYAAAGEFGRSLYAGVLARLVPLSYALALLIWTASLWRCEFPVTPARPDFAAAAGLPLPMREQLRRFNASLTRVLRRK